MRAIDVLLLVSMLALFALVLFVILPWKLRRAMNRLVETFRQLNATTPQNAIAEEKLRIARNGPFNVRAKDYKRDALNVLIRAEIVQMTEDNKLYLSEERLKNTKLYKPPSLSYR
ncbi:hypothetical protein ACFLUQ_01940 [Chloroflexota bacterium]